MNTLTYEKDYLDLKLQRVHRKLHNEVAPQLGQKLKLKELLESIYEGQ